MRTKRTRQPGPSRKRRHVLMMLQWYSHIYQRGIARYAKAAGWSLDASTAHLPFAPSLASVDGVIGNIFCRTATLDSILALSLPVVNMGQIQENIPLPCVLLDYVSQGAAVAAHFIERGFRHFAYCGDTVGAVHERLRGYRGELRRHGLDCALTVIRDRDKKGHNTSAFFEILGRQLKAMPKPVALMALNDDLAVSMLEVCDHAHLRVPDDVAIIGCDNDELVCEFARVPLSSVESNLERQAHAAAALLDRLMDGAKPPRKPIRIPHGGIVERQSSNILAVSHPGLARTIRTIWRDYPNPGLSVERLAQDAGMSRRGLDLACTTHLGRTISQELQRVRLDKAIHLLEKSALRIAEITRLCGYGRVEHLRNAILREHGVAPRQYRRNSLARQAAPAHVYGVSP